MKGNLLFNTRRSVTRWWIWWCVLLFFKNTLNRPLPLLSDVRFVVRLCHCRWPMYEQYQKVEEQTINGATNLFSIITFYSMSIVMAHMGIKWLFDWTFSVKYLYRYKGNKRIKATTLERMWDWTEKKKRENGNKQTTIEHMGADEEKNRCSIWFSFNFFLHWFFRLFLFIENEAFFHLFIQMLWQLCK